MKHSFIDKYSHLNSIVHKLDPRIKLLITFLGIIIIVSEPPGNILPFAFYGVGVLILILLSRIPFGFILKRFLIISPFILMAALFFPVSLWLTKEEQIVNFQHPAFKVALSIFLKAGLSILLLILLVSTDKFHNLLLGLRKLKMPKLIGVIAALMYRYIFILSDEALKTKRAKESRTPGRLKVNKMKVFSNQMAMIFLRSWERSKIIYHSMLSRGFNGEFPVRQKLAINSIDIMFFVLYLMIFLAIRLLIEPVI